MYKVIKPTLLSAIRTYVHMYICVTALINLVSIYLHGYTCVCTYV